VLKISDFGMATKWPAPPGIDGEGDREYIGPEILMGRFDKPSDIFALGLIMLEIAGNVMLPDNGTSWQRLRSGDMSDVPSLTWSSETSTVFRDSSGKPLSQDVSVEDFYGSDSDGENFESSNFLRRRHAQRKQESGRYQFSRTGELAQPPDFMIDANHPEALDNVVRWMISPPSADRPVVDQILQTSGVRWAEARRRAGATIYEGNWGPADEVLADDAEMIDV
jgi:mitosis inhibitor protein kinase SWE1